MVRDMLMGFYCVILTVKIKYIQMNSTKHLHISLLIRKQISNDKK